MELYKRDYTTITDAEKNEWKEVKKKEKVVLNDTSLELTTTLYHKYPKAVKHYLSLFPNQFIDPTDLRNDQERFINLISNFHNLISDPTTNEEQLIKFIKAKQAYFIIGSILRNNYQFGHHSLFLFPEFEMPPNYRADYLLVGKNSNGHHFVFVELENPYGSITLQDGSFGETIRKGIKQIEDWEIWLEQNFPNLELVFKKALQRGEKLPEEFRKYDKSRIHYVVIAGRRDDYDEKTYRLRRNNHQQRQLLILHYDNLIDYSKEIIGKPTY